jgi:hypothetical protein
MGTLATLETRGITAVDELVDPVASVRAAPMDVRHDVLRAHWLRLDLDGVVIEMGAYSFPVAIRAEGFLPC